MKMHKRCLMCRTAWPSNGECRDNLLIKRQLAVLEERDFILSYCKTTINIMNAFGFSLPRIEDAAIPCPGFALAETDCYVCGAEIPEPTNGMRIPGIYSFEEGSWHPVCSDQCERQGTTYERYLFDQQTSSLIERLLVAETKGQGQGQDQDQEAEA